MAQQQGSQTRIIMDMEGTFKGTPGTDAVLVHFINESLRLSRNLITSESIRGDRDAQEPVRGNVDVGGDLTVELQGFMSKLWYGLLGSYATADMEIPHGAVTGTFIPGEAITGSVSGTGTFLWDDGTIMYFTAGVAFIDTEVITGSSSGATATATAAEGAAANTPYLTRFTVGSSLPSFVIEKQFTDIAAARYFQYSGCRVNSMNVTITSEGFQEVTFNIIGAKETVDTTTFDASDTDLTKKSFDGFSVSTLERGGSAIANVTSIDLTFENNLDSSVYVIDPSNPGERAELPAGITKVSGTVTALFDSITLYDLAVNDTETSLRIAFAKDSTTSGTIGTAGNEYMEINLNEIKFAQNAPVIDGPTGVFVELPFEAFYNDHAGSSSMDVIVHNTQATI